MSNEIDAIATQIKNGNKELLPMLWDKVLPFIRYKACSWLSFASHTIIEADDLVDECYFALLPAVNGWDKDRASFLTYLNYHLLNSFNKAYFGGITSKHKSEPINNHYSLDIRIDAESDDGNITFLDTIIDTNAEAYYRNLEDADFWESVSAFLRKSILQVNDDIGRECMLYMLDNGWESLAQVGRELYPEQPQKKIHNHFHIACKQLKRILNQNTTRRAAEKLSLDYEIYGYGYNHFVRNNYTSNIEDFVIKRIDKKQRLNDMADLFIDPD